MRIVDRGSGTPVVLVPGIQGRWEYLGPAVDALAIAHRVITFSLCDEPDRLCETANRSSLDDYVDQIDAALNDRGLERAAICGVSFGGLIALRFAARRPDRTTALVLASVPGPGWRLRPAHRIYARVPWLAAPLFFAGAPWRLRPEIAAALPDARERRAFARGVLRLLRHAPLSPPRMAARARLIDGIDIPSDCRLVLAPTLVVTGEPALDHVVPVAGTDGYSKCIAGARTVTLEHTGHLGSVTRPHAFARVVRDFLAGAPVARPWDEHAA